MRAPLIIRLIVQQVYCRAWPAPYSEALCCCEPKQPLRLAKVHLRRRGTSRVERDLCICVALSCSDPIQSPRLGRVSRPAYAAVVHVAEQEHMACLAFICASQSFRCDGPKPVPISSTGSAPTLFHRICCSTWASTCTDLISHDINVVPSALWTYGTQSTVALLL